MHRKKKLWGFILVLTGIACTFLALWELNHVKVPVECYFYDPCGGCFSDSGPCKPCTVETGLGSQYSQMIAENGLEGIADLKLYNILYKAYGQKYEAKLKKYKLADSKRKFPVVFVGDTCLMGESEVKSRIISAVKSETNFLKRIVYAIGRGKNGQPQSKQVSFVDAQENSVVYFSVPGCEDCKRVDEYLNEIRHESFKNNDFRVVSYSIELKENLSLLKKYYQIYGAGGDETVVPVVFIGDRYMEGYDQIASLLKKTLIEGEGYNTKIIKVDGDE